MSEPLAKLSRGCVQAPQRYAETTDERRGVSEPGENWLFCAGIRKKGRCTLKKRRTRSARIYVRRPEHDLARGSSTVHCSLFTALDAAPPVTCNALASVFPAARKAEISPKFRSDAGEITMRRARCKMPRASNFRAHREFGVPFLELSHTFPARERCARRGSANRPVDTKTKVT